MCLYVASGPHIAENDITVWKLISDNNISKHYGFDYSEWVGKTCPHVELKPVKRSRFLWCPLNSDSTIDEGYHAFTNEHDVLSILSTSHHTMKLVKFTIPKYATYYIGVQNEIVSSTIRCDSLKPTSWKLRLFWLNLRTFLKRIKYHVSNH